MMENPAETGVLSGDSFSHQYEVNSNEKVYSEGTTGKVETGGEMEKTSGEMRDADGSIVVEGEDGFNSAGIDDKAVMKPGNGHDDGIVQGDEDVVMADADAEAGFVGGDGAQKGYQEEYQEECIGNGGMVDQAQPAVMENGKQNGRPCDPFASPDDQPMPQAESPATQNIYDLQSSWPQQHQPHTDYIEDPQQQDGAHLNQEEISPAGVIYGEQEEQRDQAFSNEQLDYADSDQNLEEDEVERAISGNHSDQYDIEKEEGGLQDHLDPYEATAIHAEQRDIEKEKETPKEYPDHCEEATYDPEQTDLEKEKDISQEYLDPATNGQEQIDIEKEKEVSQEYLDPSEGATYDSELKDIVKEKEITQECLNPTTQESDQKDIEKEKETSQDYLDSYNVVTEDADQQLSTKIQQDPLETTADPYTSSQVSEGLHVDQKEEVIESAEVYQEYSQESQEVAAVPEHEPALGQEDSQKSEVISQEYQPENTDYSENVQGEIEEPSSEEIPKQSMEAGEDIDAKYKDMEEMESLSKQETVTLTEAVFMQTEQQSEKEDHTLQNEEQEQLLDPYAPENADMDDARDTFLPQDSGKFGVPDQQGQQDSVPLDYTDGSLIGAEGGSTKTENEFQASGSFENDDDDQHLREGDHGVTQALGDQVQSGNTEAELPLDPIDVVFKANSEENLLGLDPEAAVCEKEQDEDDLQNLEPVLESEQNVMSSHILETTDKAAPPSEGAQPEVTHDTMQATPFDREEVNVDLSQDQETVVSSEVNTESFQSGSVIESSAPLVSQGLSQVDIEPSQQSVKEISTHVAPIEAQESNDYDGDETKEPDRSEVELEEEATEATSQGKAPSLPLLDLGDGPVQSLSIAETDQSPGQRSFEGSFSPIEDNVAVSLALEDQGDVKESGEQEESDDEEDARTETTEVEAELKEDNFEQQIQQEEESAYNIQQEVPTEDISPKEDIHEDNLDERKDVTEAFQSEPADTHIEESAADNVQDEVGISPEMPDTMQIEAETSLPETEKADYGYHQVQQELSEDLIDGGDVNAHEDISAVAVEQPSEEMSSEPLEHVAPDIVMQEYEEEEEEEEAEPEQTSYSAPAVSTDTTLQNTADKLLGESEETDASLRERVGASATPPNTPDVASSSPPVIASNLQQPSMQETMNKEEQLVEDQLAPEAEQFASYGTSSFQSEDKQESSIEDTVKHEVDEVLESAPEEPPCAPTICDDKPPSSQTSTPSIPVPTLEAKSAPDEAKEKKLKSDPTQPKKPKTPTAGTSKSPSKKSSPSASQKVKTSDKSKASDTPKKSALSRSLPKPSTPPERKEPTKASSKTPAKTSAKVPSKVTTKTPTKVPAKTPPKAPSMAPAKAPANAPTKTPTKAPAKTPVKASPKVPAPSTRLTASAKKPTGPAGTTPTRSRTAPLKLDTKPSESKPKPDKAKMSGVKQKTVTTVTKTTHTEVRSAKSSPRKSADGDARARNSPGRNGVASKIGSLDNSRHSPGGGNVKIKSEKTNYSTVQSRCGSLGNATHKAGGGHVKILHDPVTFSKSSSRVGSMENAHHSPHGGKVKILNQSADFSKTAKSKVGSLDNATHSPGGGKVKIENKKVDFSKKVTSKIGSLDNSTHRPGGGRVKIENKKLDFKEKAASKIGSKDNITHKAGGGQVKIENKKLDFKEKAASKVGSKDNIEHKPGGGQVKIQEEKLEFKTKAASKVGSLDNASHIPGGGDVRIQDEKLEFSAKAHSKVGSLDKADHQPTGGDVKILDEKLEFSAKAHSKVGSLDNADHQPTGGDVKIFDEKPTFQHVSPRTDDGIH